MTNLIDEFLGFDSVDAGTLRQGWRVQRIRLAMVRVARLRSGMARSATGCRTRVVFEAFNIFDAKASDIDYFYASRLPGELADGVEDIHTHPVLSPISARRYRPSF